MGSHHRTTGRMRGLATLALMSLLLIHGGAQPLSPPTTEEQPEGAYYPKTFDCKGGVSVNQDDSGTTLTCDGNTHTLEPCEDGKSPSNMNQVDGKITVTFDDNQGNGGIETHGSWPGVETHGNWPGQQGSWPGQQGSWPGQYGNRPGQYGYWPGQYGNNIQQHRGWFWSQMLAALLATGGVFG